MKYVAVFIFSILLVTSNVHAKENLDGKALECFRANTKPADNSYWIFGEHVVMSWYVTERTPLKIRKWNYGGYNTYTNSITWDGYTLVRESLVLKFLNKAAGSLGLPLRSIQCKLTTPAEIEKILNKEIDKLRAKMKKNKL